MSSCCETWISFSFDPDLIIVNNTDIIYNSHQWTWTIGDGCPVLYSQGHERKRRKTGEPSVKIRTGMSSNAGPVLILHVPWIQAGSR